MAQIGQGTPNLLHILQVVSILGSVMAILVLLAMVVVGVVFVAGNGTHRNAGLFALDGVNGSNLVSSAYFFCWTSPWISCWGILLGKLKGFV